MLTMFQMNALRAIANVGAVYMEEDGKSNGFTRDGIKRFGWVIRDKQGARIAIAEPRGTYGFIGLPTLRALEHVQFLNRNGNCYSVSTLGVDALKGK